MFRFNLTCAAAIAMLICTGAGATSARAQNLVDNPIYLSWAKHQPGTTVVMKMATQTEGQNINMHITQTLKEVKPDELTVELTNAMEMAGQKHAMPPTTVTFKSKVTEEEAKFGEMPQGMKGEIKELGTETVTVGGKSYECTVSQITSESEGVKTTGKVWRSDEVPGQMVKGEMNFEGKQTGTMKMELVSVEKR